MKILFCCRVAIILGLTAITATILHYAALFVGVRP